MRIKNLQEHREQVYGEMYWYVYYKLSIRTALFFLSPFPAEERDGRIATALLLKIRSISRSHVARPRMNEASS